VTIVALGGETFGVEAFGVGPEFGPTVGDVGAQKEGVTGGDAVAPDLVFLGGGTRTLYYPVDWIDPATGMRLEDYGESAVEMVVAHEMAHHTQLQMHNFGIPGVESTPGTQMELEADCLAGVYAKRATTQPAGIEAALVALGEAGGPGHGTSDQRIAAFELGYATGDEARCLSMGNGGGATTQGGDSEVM
jgi:hypothetical protein